MLVDGLAQPARPGAAHPRPVGAEVLRVVAAEVVGELVERRPFAALGRVVGIGDADVIEDRPVPRPVERGRDEIGCAVTRCRHGTAVEAARGGRVRRGRLLGDQLLGRQRGDLVEQRAESKVGEPPGQLVQPGQPPRCLLVGGQGRDGGVRVGVEAGQRREPGELRELAAAFAPAEHERRVLPRQPWLAVRRHSRQGLPLRADLAAQRPAVEEAVLALLRVVSAGENLGQPRPFAMIGQQIPGGQVKLLAGGGEAGDRLGERPGVQRDREVDRGAGLLAAAQRRAEPGGGAGVGLEAAEASELAELVA